MPGHALAPATLASRTLEQEGRAMLTRIAQVRPFALHEPMVAAAAPTTAAQTAIERYLADGRRELRGRVHTFLRWLRADGRGAAPEEAQRRFTYLRLRFNVVLSHFDVFADTITQRSEHGTGVWLAGLDCVAADALDVPGRLFDPPPVICYLDRGQGAAIRRARTRLPGGGSSPVAIVRVPRERMLGAGIASSLVHEVGHQAAALLGLVDAVRPLLQSHAAERPAERLAWTLWGRWISEIIPDLWALARVGVSATTGLMSVVSLPRAFVFRANVDDPHPMPWIRVALSCALGSAMYPDPQWGRIMSLWKSFYPLRDDGRGERAAEPRALVALLRATMPELVHLLLAMRPAALHGATIPDALRVADRRPATLRALYGHLRSPWARMRAAPPTLAFAVLGQARADGRLSPGDEHRMLADLLTHWALRDTLDTAAYSAGRQRRRTALTFAT